MPHEKNLLYFGNDQCGWAICVTNLASCQTRLKSPTDRRRLLGIALSLRPGGVYCEIMKQVVASQILEIPDYVKLEVRARQVRVKGKRGEVIQGRGKAVLYELGLGKQMPTAEPASHTPLPSAS